MGSLELQKRKIEFTFKLAKLAFLANILIWSYLFIIMIGEL